MEQLGFELIPIVKDASIQKSRLKNDLELMEKVTDQYNGMIDEMDKADVQNNTEIFIFVTFSESVPLS